MSVRRHVARDTRYWLVVLAALLAGCAHRSPEPDDGATSTVSVVPDPDGPETSEPTDATPDDERPSTTMSSSTTTTISTTTSVPTEETTSTTRPTVTRPTTTATLPPAFELVVPDQVYVTQTIDVGFRNVRGSRDIQVTLTGQCSDDDRRATAVGTCSISATQPGGASRNASIRVVRPFAIAVDPGTASYAVGTTAEVSIVSNLAGEHVNLSVYRCEIVSGGVDTAIVKLTAVPDCDIVGVGQTTAFPQSVKLTVTAERQPSTFALSGPPSWSAEDDFELAVTVPDDVESYRLIPADSSVCQVVAQNRTAATIHPLDEGTCTIDGSHDPTARTLAGSSSHSTELSLPPCPEPPDQRSQHRDDCPPPPPPPPPPPCPPPDEWKRERWDHPPGPERPSGEPDQKGEDGRLDDEITDSSGDVAPPAPTPRTEPPEPGADTGSPPGLGPAPAPSSATDPAPRPEATPEPDSTAQPKPELEPAAQPEPETTPQPAPETEPEAAPEPEPALQPAREATPEREPEPAVLPAAPTAAGDASGADSVSGQGNGTEPGSGPER